MDLSLDDHRVCTQAVRSLYGLFHTGGQMARGNGYLLPGKKLFGLIFVNLHALELLELSDTD
jgi:hypothetical protein